MVDLSSRASYHATVHRVLAFLILAIAAIASADDAYWVTVGTVGSMGKSKDIRMVSEEVRIKLHDHSMSVRASFDFKNDGKAQTVTMAFPEGIADAKKRDQSDTIAITKFHSWVNGKEVSVTRKALGDGTATGNYTAVWLKQVSFAARGKRHVVCEYEANYGEGEGWIQTYYILRSGATWKGNIGDCKMYVDWNDLHDQGPPKFESSLYPLFRYSELHTVGFAKPFKDNEKWRNDRPLKPRRVDGKSAFLEFKNFEPTEDVSMGWITGFTNYVVNGHPCVGGFLDPGGDATAKGPGSDPLVQLMAIPCVFGTKKDVDAMDQIIDENTPTDFGFRHVDIEFPDNEHVRINGHLKKLERPLEKSDSEKWPPGRWVHVKDLVAAMGGSYRYDAKSGAADIRVKFRR